MLRTWTVAAAWMLRNGDGHEIHKNARLRQRLCLCGWQPWADTAGGKAATGAPIERQAFWYWRRRGNLYQSFRWGGFRDGDVQCGRHPGGDVWQWHPLCGEIRLRQRAYQQSWHKRHKRGKRQISGACCKRGKSGTGEGQYGLAGA